MENKTFDDASTAAQQMFTDGEQPSAEVEPTEEVSVENNTEVAEEPVAEPSVLPENANAEDTLANAANVAEAAAEAAQAANNENEQLKAELDAANARIEELSKQNEKHVVEDALTPPVLDIEALTFADGETQKAIMEKYNAEIAEYNRKVLMSELSPELEFAREERAAKERGEIIAGLGATTEFADIGNYAPQIEQILKKNSAFSGNNLSMEEKIVNAYLIARGVNSINNPPVAPKEPTTEELMALYQNNPAFREAVEKQRIAEIKNSQQVPPFSASSGAVNAALDINEEPRTLEEASARARKMFGAE